MNGCQSQYIPTSFTLSEFSIVLPLIFKLCGLILLLLLSVITAWDLSGFTIMQLFVNHFIAHSDASSDFSINSCKSLEKTEMVLSLAKLWKSAVLNQRDRSLIKMLKRIGPNMEPCGTLKSNSLKRLYVLLILTFCWRRFK